MPPSLPSMSRRRLGRIWGAGVLAAFSIASLPLPAMGVIDTSWAREAFFLTPDPLVPPEPVFNPIDYGARGDARTDDRAAIQRAIDAQAAAGAGCVYFRPTRTFLVRGTLLLRDNSTLYLDHGSKLLSSARVADIPDIEPAGHHSWGAEHYHRKSVLHAEGVRNVRILGHGVIDGNVHQFDGVMEWNSASYRQRIHLLRFLRCENVLIRGIRLVNPVFWTQVYSECRNVVIDGIEVESWQEQKNGDGLNIDSCEQVIVRGARIRSNDDAICLKTMSTAPLRNIVVEDCHILGSNANGLKIGTETHGPIERVVFRNCRVENTNGAICLYTVDGGPMSGVLVENIRVAGALSAISIRLGARHRTYAGGPQSMATATMRDITVRNVHAEGIRSRHENFIAGLPGHPIENVILENIRIDSIAAGSERDRSLQPEMKIDAYPRHDMFGDLPAWGLWARDVRGLHLQDVDLHCAGGERRFVMAFDRVSQASLRNVVTDNVPAPLVDVRGDTNLPLNRQPLAGDRVRIETR